MIPVLALAIGLLTGACVYLMLGRKMFSAILGLTLLAHAANLVVLAGGGLFEAPPIVAAGGDWRLLADPVPQAFVLTAIVISMAMTLYLLAVFVAGGRGLGSVDIDKPMASDEGRHEAEVRGELAAPHGDVE